VSGPSEEVGVFDAFNLRVGLFGMAAVAGDSVEEFFVGHGWGGVRGEGRVRNSKFECRNPKQARNSKPAGGNFEHEITEGTEGTEGRQKAEGRNEQAEGTTDVQGFTRIRKCDHMI